METSPRSCSVHSSQQSHVTNSTLTKQIGNPQTGANSSKCHTLSSSSPGISSRLSHQPLGLNLEQDSAWQSRPGWEFLPPKSTPLTTSGRPRAEGQSPTAPNFSRPFASNPTEDYFPHDFGGQQIRSTGRPTRSINDASGSSSGRSASTTASLTRTAPDPKPTPLRKDRYSSKSLYSGSSSDTSSRAKTMSSADSHAPLIPPTRRQDWVTKLKAPQPSRSRYVPRDEYTPPTPRPLLRTLSEQRTPTPEPPREELREPTLDVSTMDMDEHDAITALPIVSPNRPGSYASAAEPPTIRDDRIMANSVQSQAQGGKTGYRTGMSSFPEVMRRTEYDQDPHDGRRWSASTFDMSNLSAEKIAKLKKKGVNPALYLEMKAARGESKKSRMRLPPLVGNTFL